MSSDPAPAARHGCPLAGARRGGLAGARLWVVLALLAALPLSGCPASLFDVDDDDSADDDFGPPGFSYLRYDFALDVDDTAAVADLSVVVLDAQAVELCRYPIRFQADVDHGPYIGGPFWSGITAGLTLTAASDPGTSDCPDEYGLPYHDAPSDLIVGWSPMGFVGCDDAQFDASFLGDDPTGVGDGTFSSYCLQTAPAVRGAMPDAGLGEIEGIWLGRGVSGQLDGVGQYSYLPGDDGSWVWYVWGLLYAADDHPSEPITGLAGRYLAVPFWLFIPY